MSLAVTLPREAGWFALPHPFVLEHGAALEGAQLAFELHAADAPQGAPLVVVLGGITATRHVCRSGHEPAPGWWDALVGPGAAIDTRRFRVLGIDYLGGGGASAGSVSTGVRPFPAVSTRDQARALELLLRDLGDEAPVSLVGASFGGMVGLALAERAPSLLSTLVVIGAADRPHPLASAWRSLQRRIVELGLATGTVREAMAIARGLALTTYRSAEELARRFDVPTPVHEPRARPRVTDWLEARGATFADDFDPHAFLALSQALDLHRIDPGAISVPTTVVGIASDALVPLPQVRALAERLGGPSRLVVLSSPCGHDAFLVEHAAMASILRQALAAEEARP